MTFRKTLMMAAGVLLAGTVAAAARPAVVTTDLNIRNGPGTRYAVIGSLQAGTTVNVGACSSGWCRVGGGFASASYLQGGGARTRVVVQPDYYYDDGPGIGAFALGVGVGSVWGGPGWGYGPGWYGSGWRGGYWGGNPGWRGPGWRGPGWRGAGWRGPGWNGPGRPGWNRAGWNGGGRPGWRGSAPGFRGPVIGGRPVIYRGGGFRGGMGGMGRMGGGGFRGGRF